MTWLNWSLKLHIRLRTISILILTHTSHMFMFNKCHIHLCDCTWLNVFHILNFCWSNTKKFLSVLIIFGKSIVFGKSFFFAKISKISSIDLKMRCIDSKRSIVMMWMPNVKFQKYVIKFMWEVIYAYFYNWDGSLFLVLFLYVLVELIIETSH